jgi:SAM-dependent methyltransferase
VKTAYQSIPARAAAAPVSFAQFRRQYEEAVQSVWTYWSPAMQEELALHNVGWGLPATDFRLYLDASVVRYHLAYKALTSGGGVRTVCDVGGFWGAFPLTLRALGYAVTMTEALEYYSQRFDGLFAFLRGAGIEILDLDPFAPGASIDRRFDFVSVMAVVEHFPHSLRDFMANVTRMMATGGQLYIEVPNIAFWPKRMSLLRGETPLVPVGEIYDSRVPFIGHHHEFTAGELQTLGSRAGLVPIREHFYNYSPHVRPGIRTTLRHPLWSLAFALRRDAREVIAMAFRTRQGQTT